MTNLLSTSQCKTQILYNIDSVCPTSRCWFAGQTGLSDLIFTLSNTLAGSLAFFVFSYTHRNTPKPSKPHRQSNSFNVNIRLILQPELITSVKIHFMKSNYHKVPCLSRFVLLFVLLSFESEGSAMGRKPINIPSMLQGDIKASLDHHGSFCLC